MPPRAAPTRGCWSRRCWPPTCELEAGGVFEAELVDSRPGFASALFRGKGARRLFEDEAGGHRWQRIPPDEKRGRVHTSTVTCAVLDAGAGEAFQLDRRDVTIQTTKGSGPGGQHRNKVESCVVATHRETGVRVRVDMRSQHQSRSVALEILAARLAERAAADHTAARSEVRRLQCGTGMRGDKIRTYRTQDDRVTDHRTGRSWSLKAWARGDWAAVG